MKINLLPLDSQSPHFDSAVAVYSEYAVGYPSYHQRFFLEHAERKDFIGLVAQVDARIVGVSFGSASLAGQWWHDTVAKNVGAEHAALQAAWVLTQLNVLAAYRDEGIGGLLHAETIRRQPYRNLLLSTQVANKAAQRFYKRNDWHILHEGFSFMRGDEPYAIMYKIKT